MAFWQRKKKPLQTESERFGNHQIIKLIHEGEKSSVYLVRHPDDDLVCVAKAYRPAYDRTARTMRKKYRVKTEGEIGMSLNPPEAVDPRRHPIIETFDYGQEFGRSNGCHYVVLEYVDGFNLKNMINVKHPRLWENRLRIVARVCLGLKLIHEKGLVHRDICSDNVLLYRDFLPKIIDLGFVCPAGTRFDEKSGTPSYMSPEQILGQPVHPTADIYSLGVVIYEVLAGRLPFTSDLDPDDPAQAPHRASELMEQHLRSDPPRPSKVSPYVSREFEHIILRCMEKEPHKRFASALDVIEALQETAGS